jgi:hypothetical protein
VSKIQLFFLSLVGALPAGFLSYLLGMYLISQPSGASSMVMIVSIITLICSATLTLTPFLILAMYYSNYDPPKVSNKSKAQPEADEVEDLDETEEIPSKKTAKQPISDDEDEVESFIDDESSESLPVDDDDFATMDDDELATMDDEDEK